MTTVTLLMGMGILLAVGVALVQIKRELVSPGALVRCPMNGHTIVVQHIADESSYLTDVVTCSAFPRGQTVTCGLPCLTGGVRTQITGHFEDRAKV